MLSGNFRFTGFYDLLADALYQHKLAAAHTDSYLMNRHSRASISASIFTLECAANCMLSSLQLSAKFNDELDKLSFLAKIEVFIKFKNIKSFERGRNEVQKVVKLIKVRNDYVHPKVLNIKTEASKPEKIGELYKIPMSLNGEHWDALAIPKCSMFWSSNDALNVIKAIIDFYFYLFNTVLNLSSEKIEEILLSRFEFDKLMVSGQYEEFKKELKSASEFGIKLEFICSY
jgi:hypothetical protein